MAIAAALQAAALVAALWGTLRLASGVAFLCPAIILGVILSRMGPTIHWGNVTLLEKAFLAVNLASALVSLLLLRRNGRPAGLFWAIWIANSLSCAAMIYLAFFFRLFG